MTEDTPGDVAFMREHGYDALITVDDGTMTLHVTRPVRRRRRYLWGVCLSGAAGIAGMFFQGLPLGALFVAIFAAVFIIALLLPAFEVTFVLEKHARLWRAECDAQDDAETLDIARLVLARSGRGVDLRWTEE